MIWRVVILLALGICNVVLFSRVIWGSTGILEYRELKNRHESLQKEIRALDAENLALSKEIRLLQTDNKYVEKIVRQRLHYVRDNEILYIFGKQSENKPGAVSNDRKN